MSARVLMSKSTNEQLSMRGRMPTSAKTRARRRATSDGAVIFVTAMTLAVLASLGLYALSATRAEVRASGYETRAMMSDGLQQWALNLAMNYYTTTPGMATYIQQNSDYKAVGYPMHNCIALANVPTTEPTRTQVCGRNTMSAYLGTTLSGMPQNYPAIWAPQGRGYQATPDLVTETTNIDVPVDVVSGDSRASAYKLVTLTSYGMLRMTTPGNLQSGLQVVKQSRSHLVVGPL